MSRLWYFYPENDMALAAGVANYTPSHSAALFHRVGAFLPVWLADDDDFVVYDFGAHSADNEAILNGYEWEDAVRNAFRLGALRFEPRDAALVTKPTPWGWSAASRRELSLLGVEQELMPSASDLDFFRRISHRATSIEINRRLAAAGIDTPPIPAELHSEAELQAELDKVEPLMLKQPWSSSGRGVVDTSCISDKTRLLRQLAGIIKRQGSVIAEPHLDKIADFAMLFEIDARNARYAGLSVFDNVRGCSYAGNYVESQPLLLKRLVDVGVNPDTLDAIASQLSKILSDITAGRYEGWAGVDMMVYRKADGSAAVAPCVELNLRMTMGVVALKLAERFLAEGSRGYMREIRGVTESSETPVVVDRRLVSGSVELLPPNPWINFCFSAEKVD